MLAKAPAPTTTTKPRHTAAVRIVRPKLKVGSANDEAEKQADRIADKVVRGPAPVKPLGSNSSDRNAVRRAIAPQAALASAAHAAGYETPSPEDEHALPESLEERLLALTHQGRPLPDAVRIDMESRFGMDLSSVRIHTDNEAAQLADSVHAHAFTLGEHIAFNAGAFQPDNPTGRHLLAHELAHVAQHRAAVEPAEQTPVRRGFWGDVYDSVADSLGDIAEWAWDKVQEVGWRLLESISPDLARTVREIVDEGILAWLGRQVSRAWDGFIGGLRALVPFEGPQQLIDLFAGMVERAASIVAALASGNCEPLMAAISDLKNFVVETVGVAWDKLTEFLSPIGEFFTDLWESFGAPAVQWLQDFGGDVWDGIQELGRTFWEWIRPVREAAERIWNWFKDLLFGSDDSGAEGGSEGVVGWISRKAGEAWDWVKERTRPVWEPVANFASQVAELIPPAFVRDMGESAQQLSADLNAAGEGMDGGDGVAENRDTLASILPSVEDIIATVRNIIVGAGAWLTGKIGELASSITGLIGRLNANALLSWLGAAFGWLADLVNNLLLWAREKVSGLFNWLVQGFDALTPFIRLALETIRKLITVAADLVQLPMLILNSVWGLVPACIREPIENFIKTQVLGRIPVFGQFFTDPELWPRVEQTALRILRRIFVDGDLLGAAWEFFRAVLSIIGVPAELVVQIIAKAAGAIGDILTNPIGFMLNLLAAMRDGFLGFCGNIGTHLLNGVSGWLFGTLRSAGISPPADFSASSIFNLALQLFGITVDNVLNRLGERVGHEVVARLRRMLDVATGAWSFVSALITDGPAGLWREIQERLSNIWDMALQGIAGWISERVIGRAVIWLGTLVAAPPLSTIIEGILMVYRAIESFMEYLRELLELVNGVLDGITDIARGNITTAATFLENALGNSLPIAIGFLANQIGLGRISERIREILGGLQERVNGAIDWLIDRAIRLGQAVLDLARRGVSAARTAVSRLGAWAMQVLGLSKRFTTSNGEEHRLFFEEQGENVVLMVASDEKTYEDFLIHITVPANTPMATRKAEGIAKAREIDALIASRRRTSTDAATGVRDQTPEFTTKLNELSLITRDLMSDSTAGPLPVTPVPTYGGQQDGFGKRMSVTPLTTHGAPGTPVQVDNPTYRSLLKRKENPGGRSYYIAGHLLNNNVHGSGTTWDNLTPISQRTNQQHERDVESKVKDAVDDNAILEYTVDVDYTRNLARNNALIAEILRSASPSGALPPDLTIKKEVIEAEQKLPKQLVCTVRKIDAAGVEDASFADRRTQYPITNVVQEDTLDQYYIDGATFDPNAELAALTTEARAALSANATLLWSAFRTSNGGRIDRLQEANAALVDQLRLVFREHHRDRAYAAEAAAIPGLSELQTWTAYKGGRAIYDPSSDSAMTVTQISQLEQAFNTRRDNLRTQATSEKIVAAGGLSTEENWGSFRQRLSVYASDGALTEDQVTQVRTAFDARMAALRNATTTNP